MRRNNDMLKPLKRTFSALLDKTIKKNRSKIEQLVLYKIVDADTVNTETYYKLQCTYTKAVVSLTIEDIVFDLDILHGLHPIQACFIGIEYAKNATQYQKTITSSYTIGQSSTYTLLYQDRKGILHFECKDTLEQFSLAPKDIAFNEHVIEYFNAKQAFQIGVLVGLQLVKNTEKQQDLPFKNPHRHYLTLVKK